MKKPQNPIEVLLIGLCVLSIGIAFGLSYGGVALTGSVPGRGTFNPGGMAVASSDSIHAIGFVGIFFGMAILALYFKLKSDLNDKVEPTEKPDQEVDDSDGSS